MWTSEAFRAEKCACYIQIWATAVKLSVSMNPYGSDVPIPGPEKQIIL